MQLIKNKDKIINIDEKVEASIRPQYLNNFVGQAKLKDNLRIFLDAAIMKKRSLDHILFYGPPGLGKTTLANIISKEMNANFKLTSGPAITKVGDLAAILTNLKDNDILFIDEIHRLPIAIEETLYSAMEDFRLDIIVGTGPAAKSIKIDLAKFTLVSATTKLGLVSNPLRDRFGIIFQLEFYSFDELKDVIIHCSKLYNVIIEPKAAYEVAKRSRGTPRIAIRLTKRVIDVAIIKEKLNIDITFVIHALNLLGVDKLGLDDADLKYMKFIFNNYKGGPVGIETIAAGLYEDKMTLEDTVEPYLIQNGLLERTSRGRVLTILAISHINQESY